MGRISYLQAILLGGLIAGTVDIGAASLINGLSPVFISQFIAGGLLGKASLDGGMRTAALGVALQWAMSILIAAIYVLASTRLDALRRSWLRFEVLYGIPVYFVMEYVVMPLVGLASRAQIRAPAVRGEHAGDDGVRRHRGVVRVADALTATKTVLASRIFRGRHFMKIIACGLLAMAVWGPVEAFADDSSAALAAGGLVFTKQADIRMASEDLFISPRQVKVRYEFVNDGKTRRSDRGGLPAAGHRRARVLVRTARHDARHIAQFHGLRAHRRRKEGRGEGRRTRGAGWPRCHRTGEGRRASGQYRR